MNFVAIDFETANSERKSACSVGLVVVENGIIVDRIYHLIKPTPNHYDEFNTTIHGISFEDTANEPKFDVVWEKIEPIFRDKYLVAHRAQFDMGVIRDLISHFDLQMPQCNVVCTEVLSRNTLESDCYGLATVVKLLGLPYANHHHALCDAEMTANIFIEIAKKYETNDIAKLLSENNVKLGSFSAEGYKPCVKKQDSSHLSEYMEKLGHVKLSGDVLVKDLSISDSNNLFYDKKVVITGVFDFIDREQLAMKLKCSGADINTTISKKTNYVIIGVGAGPSKMQKIEKLQNEGCDIKIIDVEMLKKLLGDKCEMQSL